MPCHLFCKARIFLLVDLWDFFSDLGSGDEKKKKSYENDQLTCHFQSFFFDLSFSELFSFRAFFLISPEKTTTVKLVR